MLNKLWLPIITLICQWGTWIWTFFEVKPQSSGQGKSFLWYKVGMIGYLAICLFFVTMVYRIWRSFHLAQEIEILRKEENLQKKQKQDMDIIQKNAVHFRQEILPELKQIRSLLNHHENEKAIREIRELSDHFEKVRMHALCSDSLLNAILQAKKEVAENKNIEVFYEIVLPSKIELQSTELSSIFFNLLDNAIEACEISEEEKPFIKLRVKHQANMLSIHMENSKNAKIQFTKGTSKTDTEQHGLGLVIIEDIVEKYEGICEWIDKGSTFSSEIMIRTDISIPNYESHTTGGTI